MSRSSKFTARTPLAGILAIALGLLSYDAAALNPAVAGRPSAEHVQPTETSAVSTRPPASLAPAGPSRAYWAPMPAPPKAAPNVLLIMSDDVGFGASSVFGGPVPTPNFQLLADNGVRFTRFHTTGMCSPSRAALLTGRNHHAVGFGAIAEAQAGFPGYNTILPADSRTFVEVMERNGYATSMFGKHHLVSSWQQLLTGPQKQWPNKLGFDYFYGFLSADADQWHPKLFRGTNLEEGPGGSTGLLDRKLADDAIRWIHQQKADSPEKPFLMYYAPGSTHAPHQAPPEWIAQFRSRFSAGWDVIREQTVRRQRQLGILPTAAAVTPRPPAVPAWDSLSSAQQRLYGRFMEVYAAQLAYQDAQIGRVIEELRRMGEWDNTLVILILGDNGASAEGGVTGTLSELRRLFDQPATFTPAEEADLTRLGGPDSYQNYQAGWAWAMNAPFPLFKQDASHLGGVRNAMIASWPNRVSRPGDVVERFAHITDIAPTILQAAGISMPDSIDGIVQTPLAGRSLLKFFSDPRAPEDDRTQYFELYGNRALYRNGWWASTIPGRLPWERRSAVPAGQFQWQLFNLNDDPAQAIDVADLNPGRLAAMKDEWLRQARLNNVLPLRADGLETVFRDARHPEADRREFVFWGSDIHLAWTEQPDLQRGSFSIQADFTLPDASDGEGVLLATGSSIAGWSLGLENGFPVLYHAATEAAADRFRIAGDQPASAGPHRLVVDFRSASEVTGSGGTVSMTLDGRRIACNTVLRRARRPSSQNESFDIGMDLGAPVVPNSPDTRRFQGQITKIVVRTHQ